MRTSLHLPPPARYRSIAAAAIGALALLGSLLVASPAQALSDTGTGGVFVPASVRILDTKDGTGGYSTPMPANEWRTIAVAGLGGIPTDGSVGAVSLSATMTDIPSAGILYGRPDPSQASTSMGIYGGSDNNNTSFSAVLAVSSSGTIQVKTQNSVRLTLAVQGYYTANTDGTAPGGLVPLNGKRIVDTRTGLGAPKGTVGVGSRFDVQVSGTAGVPAGASAAIVNLIALNSTADTGFLTPYAAGSAKTTTNFTYAAGTTTNMQAQVPLSADGKITIYNARTTIDLVVDVQAYFTAAGTTGANFTPAAARLYDSRATGNTILAADETRAISVAGQAGVPVMGSGVDAVVLSLTVAHGGADNGSARVWANGTTEPNITSINFDYDTIRTNTITVPIGANGKISLRNLSKATHYVLDVQGWYSTPGTPEISCPTPYSNGANIPAPTADSVTCTIVAAASAESAGTLAYSRDSEDVQTQPLSATGATTATVSISTSAGEHAISAYLLDDAGTDTNVVDYSFTVGNWRSASLTGVPSSGETTDQTPYLYLDFDSAFRFPDDARFQFQVSRNEQGSDFAWKSSWVASNLVRTPGLSNGQYFWRTVISAGGSDPTLPDVVSPWFAFTASNVSAGEENSRTSSADIGTYTVSSASADTSSSPSSTFETTPSSSATSAPNSWSTSEPAGNGGEAAVPLCPSSANSTKKIGNSMPRKHWPNVVSGGHADLICGTAATRGMRHIWYRHGGDWTRVANKYPTGIEPVSLMRQAIAATYAQPERVAHQAGNDTFLYQATLRIKDQNGKVVKTYQVKAPVGNGNWYTISAYPM